MISQILSLIPPIQVPSLPDLGSVGDLALALVAGLIAGAVAFRLGQPLLVGYLLAGMAVGPFALGLVHDVNSVQGLADFGVAVLMFALAIEFSLAQLRRVWRVAIVGGAIQVTFTAAVGWVIGRVIGLDAAQAAFLGGIIALSSTTVVLKILADRNELDTLYGRIITGLLIVQDLSVVPMMVILPALASSGVTVLWSMALAVVKAIVVLAIVMFLGIRLFPKTLIWVAATQSRELFLLTVIAIILGTAIAAYTIGLSLAFGAFIAGLVVSESYLSHEILAELRPLRDVFVTIFFVTVGMLVNPSFVVLNIGIVLFVVVVTVLVKFVLGMAITLAYRYPPPVALTVGLGLIQVGEFSFVLARLGVERGLVSDFIYSLTLTLALITILLTPASLRAGGVLCNLFGHLPVLARLFVESYAVSTPNRAESPTQHVVICGYGRIGRILGRVLAAREFKYFVIDYDPHVIEDLRDQGVPAVYGDGSHLTVLSQANLPRARALVICIPDPVLSELTVRNALRLNPKLDIIVRAQGSWAINMLREAGAAEIAQPEFEAGLEMVRHVLHRFGVSSLEIQALLTRLRETLYQAPGDNGLFE